jgi:hypothetical protein
LLSKSNFMQAIRNNLDKFASANDQDNNAQS